MISNPFLKYLLVASCMLFAAPTCAWQTLIGDNSSRTDQTFSFGIKAHYAQPANQLIVVGAENEKEGKEYSLAKISLNDNKVSPCAAETVMVNGIYDQPNPLYNAAIDHIICPNSTCAVVHVRSHASTLYVANHFAVEQEIVSCAIKDEHNNPCADITSLETNGDNLIFAAIKTEDKKPALVLITYSEKTDKVSLSEDEFKKLEEAIKECKGDEKKMQRLRKGVGVDQDNKYYRNVTTKFLTQGLHVISMPENVEQISALCWHAGVGCLYVAVTYHTPLNDQKCGILVARLTPDKTNLNLHPFANASLDLFEQGAIASMIPFNTSTGALDYLLVKKSNNQHVTHCLPVCNQRIIAQREHFESQGMMAQMSAAPQDVFLAPRNSFLGRQFTKPFSASADMPIVSSCDIGGGYLYAGPIGQIMVAGDVTFAVVTEPLPGFSGGIFQSQALYDKEGRISGWTLWQKTVECDGIDFALVNAAKASLMLFSQDLNGEKGTRNVQVNKWPEQATDDIAQLIEVAQKEFVECNQTITKIINLTTHCLDRNFTLLMSDEKIVVAQIPDFGAISFDKNSFDTIGTLTCAQIGTSEKIGNEDSYIFVGGTNGLAKMVDAHGRGWRVNNPLLALPTGAFHDVRDLKEMHGQPIGNYSMVRKLLFDQGFLYVLTDTCFDRIDLRTNQSVQLANADQLCNQRYVLFYDVIVSDKCALLATSSGLYRVGNGKSVLCDDSATLHWTAVQVPEATDLPLFLMPVSKSGNPHDWAKGAGQVYIITGSYTKKGAHVHRFAVQDVVDHEITDDTISPVPDFVFKDRITDIGSLLVCSDCFSTDGLFYLAPFRQKKTRAMSLCNGLTRARTLINLDLAVEDTITCITRNSMYGNWLVAGSFGLKTNI